MAMGCLPTVESCISLKAGCIIIALLMMSNGAFNIMEECLKLGQGKDYGSELGQNICEYDPLGGVSKAADYMVIIYGALCCLLGLLILIGVLASIAVLMAVSAYMLLVAVGISCVAEIILIVSCYKGVPATVSLINHFWQIFFCIIAGIYFLIVLNSYEQEISS